MPDTRELHDHLSAVAEAFAAGLARVAAAADQVDQERAQRAAQASLVPSDDQVAGHASGTTPPAAPVR